MSHASCEAQAPSPQHPAPGPELEPRAQPRWPTAASGRPFKFLPVEGDCSLMGARLGFADVLMTKLADVPPSAAPGLQVSRIASPSWVLRLEPLRVASASVLQLRYPHLASAAPAAAGIPVEPMPSVACGGSQATSTHASRPQSGAAGAAPRLAVRRTRRERLAIQMLNRLGAGLADASTDEEVRRAYRQLVRASHPDCHQTDDPATLANHAQRLRIVISAWDLFQGRETMAA